MCRQTREVDALADKRQHEAGRQHNVRTRWPTGGGGVTRGGTKIDNQPENEKDVPKRSDTTKVRGSVATREGKAMKVGKATRVGEVTRVGKAMRGKRQQEVAREQEAEK
jgi:hypothetical protein